MKNYLLLMAFLFISMSFQYPEKPLKNGNAYHVMAPSGLKMRATPNGKKLLTIPYNSAVERVDDKNYGELKVEELKDFFIEGHWVKVRYDGQEGYVFDGYLTQFPMPKAINAEYDYKKYRSSFEYYLKTNFEATTEPFNIEYNYDCVKTDEEDCICTYSQEFGNDIYYKETCSEGGFELYVELTGVTLAEAYFIIVALDVNGALRNPNPNPELEQGEIKKYDKITNEISIEADGAGCYPTIRQRRKNSVEIQMYCGC
jgi:hypothetical protein